jgi:tRNA pseudouridine38-40 synthase
LHNYQLILAYDGRGYAGWQRQQGFTTVQQRVEDALTTICGELVPLHGAGRTDAGVHALRQSAHVRLVRPMPAARLAQALNGNLPPDIRVLAAHPASPEFHARFSAIGKRYAYRFVIGPIPPVHYRGLFHWERRPLDLEAMRAAAALLRGTHDFASFATNPGYQRRRGTVRCVRHLHLCRRPHGLDLVIQGDGFLYNMVRAIAGLLRDVGRGRIAVAQVQDILAARDRRAASANLPAYGLYLVRVLYPQRA